jgi:hypothetical protein
MLEVLVRKQLRGRFCKRQQILLGRAPVEPARHPQRIAVLDQSIGAPPIRTTAFSRSSAG